MNLSHEENLCLRIAGLSYQKYVEHPDRPEFESLGHERRQWVYRSLEQRGLVEFRLDGGWIPTAAGKKWSEPNRVRVVTRRAK
jgi:hypothetical protein